MSSTHVCVYMGMNMHLDGRWGEEVLWQVAVLKRQEDG